MLRNKIILLLLAVVATVTSCKKAEDPNSVLWGETDTYDSFLWKKQVPDTLKQTLVFDFNEDAKEYVSQPIQFAFFEKDKDGHLRLVPKEKFQLFVNDKQMKENGFTVRTSDEEMQIGIVLSPEAENKMHYWYLRPVNNPGLDRINGQETYGEDDAVMEIKIRKRHVMNPLAECLMWIGIICLGALILWFIVIKPLVYPVFRVTRMLLTGPEPYMSQLKIKNYRLCVLTDKAQKQSALNKLFTGEIRYEVNPLWTAQVVIEPCSKKSVRIRPDKATYTVDARLLKTNNDYTIVNETTKTKTTIRIS